MSVSRTDELRREVASLQARLEAADARFEAIVERSGDGVLVVDAAGMVVYANAAAEGLLGRPRSQLVGREVGFPVLADGVTEVELIAAGRQVIHAEMRVVETAWEGRPCRLALLRDVTDRHRAQADLARRATHDHLTGLPNRFLFEDRLERALARLGRRSGSLAVFVVDLDGFKAVNDRLGHRAGDEVLVEVARRITRVLRASDTASRFGGDEFVLLCEGMTPETCSVLVARLQRAVTRPFPVVGTQLTIGASIGFALTDETGRAPADFIAAADAAMYAVKHQVRVKGSGR